jgi:hypothetical protein
VTTLMPTQLRWVDRAPVDLHHFNLGWVFLAPPALDPGTLRSATERLLGQHPALRTAYRAEAGRWTATVQSADAEAVVSVAPLPNYGAEPESYQADVAAAQTSMDLAAGRVVRIVHFRFGEQPGRLLVLVHHLTVDGFSMGLVADALEAGLADRARPVSSVDPAGYVAAVETWLQSDQAEQDAADWRRLGWHLVQHPQAQSPGAGTLASIRIESRSLTAEQTGRLLASCRESGVNLSQAALAAIGRAVTAHFGLTGVSIDTYHHGRTVTPGDVDAIDTIGYVQNTFPVVVPATGSALGAVCAVPSRTFGFDALRYSGGLLGELPESRVRFNFRGQMARLDDRAGALLQPAPEDPAGMRSPRQRERYLLMWEGDLYDGCLELHLKYSAEQFGQQTVEALLEDAVRRLC